MRNYFQIEKMDGDLFLSKGTGLNVSEEEDKLNEKYWNEWEEFENKEKLFKRIEELIMSKDSGTIT